MARILSLTEETLKVHIDAGKKAGKWHHDYKGFERMRHKYNMTIAQMQRQFSLKVWSTMREWWRVDDHEHKIDRAVKSTRANQVKRDPQVGGA